MSRISLTPGRNRAARRSEDDATSDEDRADGADAGGSETVSDNIGDGSEVDDLDGGEAGPSSAMSSQQLMPPRTGSNWRTEDEVPWLKALCNAQPDLEQIEWPKIEQKMRNLVKRGKLPGPFRNRKQCRQDRDHQSDASRREERNMHASGIIVLPLLTWWPVCHCMHVLPA